MKRLIFWVRVSGYISGLLGVAVMLTVRRIPLSFEQRQLGRGIGAGLLATMFICFFTGYLLHTLRVLGGRTATRRLHSDK